MKSIVVPIDFSPEAQNAVNLSIEIAQQTKADLHLIHLMTIPVDWLTVDNKEEMYPEITKKVRDTNEKFETIKKKAAFSDVSVFVYIHHNESYRGIIEYAADLDSDLIVMGSKGASGIKEILIGSYTEKIIRHAHCPVLVVKEAIHMNQIKNILMPTDLKPEQGVVVHMAKQWQKLCDAQVHLVKLNTHYTWVDSMEFEEEIKSFISEYQLDAKSSRSFDADYLEDGIIQCAEELNCELIIMGTHKRTGIAHIIAGSISENVSNHAKSLVLTLAL